MSLITDLRAVSENAVEQIAARFADLPRPLLAAIGAGDLAVEQLAVLRESLSDSIGERVSSNSLEVTDVRSAVSDLPLRAQKVAADVAAGLEQFAVEAPGKAQQLIAQLPERLSEFQSAAQSLSPDAFKETVEAYTQLVGMIYGNLAERGDRTWSKVRTTGLRPGIVVDAVSTSRPTPTQPVKAPATPPPTNAPRVHAGPTETVSPPTPRAPRTAARKAAHPAAASHTAPTHPAPTHAAPTHAAPTHAAPIHPTPKASTPKVVKPESATKSRTRSAAARPAARKSATTPPAAPTPTPTVEATPPPATKPAAASTGVKPAVAAPIVVES